MRGIPEPERVDLPAGGYTLAFFDEDGRLIEIVEHDPDGAWLRSTLVAPPDPPRDERR